MKRATIIEGALFALVGIVGVLEGLRLTRQTSDLYQMMGPGKYVLALSCALMVTGAVHLFVDLRRNVAVLTLPAGPTERKRMLGIIVLLCANVFLIQLLGYLPALVIFFLVAFRILDVRSWRTNIVLSVSLAAAYYVVFVRICDVIFPRGTLLG